MVGVGRQATGLKSVFKAMGFHTLVCQSSTHLLWYFSYMTRYMIVHSTPISKNRDIGISEFPIWRMSCVFFCASFSFATWLFRRCAADLFLMPPALGEGSFVDDGGGQSPWPRRNKPQRSTDAKRFIDSFPTRRYAWGNAKRPLEFICGWRICSCWIWTTSAFPCNFSFEDVEQLLITLHVSDWEEH